MKRDIDNSRVSKRDVFNFDHIDTSLSPEKIQEIKSLYRYYHKLMWCHRKAYRYFRRMNLLCKVGSSSLIVTGGVAGAVTMNPVVLGVISGLGVLLKIFFEAKNYSRLVEIRRFTYTT